MLPLLFASALALDFVDSGVDGVVSLDVKRVGVHGLGVQNDVQKRAVNSAQGRNTVLDSIENMRYFYTTDALIGTPAQKVNLLLDTGSSDTWVIGPNTQNDRGVLGALGGSSRTVSTTLYDNSHSSSWNANGTQWSIKYGKGSAKGDWGTDTFQLGSTKLKHLTIGVASQVSQVSQGIIGLGRPEAESTYKSGLVYNNLPMQLKQEGKINAAAYSMYMSDINSKSGTILFGGVDHSRYVGRLASMPFAHPQHLAVELSGIYSDGREHDNNLAKPIAAVLDSGTSLTYMPMDTLVNIRTALNANPSFELGERYYCDCNITSNLALDFGSVRVEVPAYQFLWPLTEMISQVEADTFFPQNSCYLGIEPSASNEDFILMGDNFIRSMYMVFDLENQQIAVAQAAKDSTIPQNVQAISLGGIPGAF